MRKRAGSTPVIRIDDILEGNPQNYNPRGFKTSCDYGIAAGSDTHVSFADCLMVEELVAGSLDNISGVVDYSDYEYLR